MNRKQRRATSKRLGDTADAVGSLSARAQAHERLGESPAALRLLKKILTLDPDNAAARFDLASLLLERGELDQASAQFARLAVLAPQSLDQFTAVLERLQKVLPALSAAISRAVAIWPMAATLEDLFEQPGLMAIAGDPFLRSVLELTVVRDYDLERLLTLIRSALLAAFIGGQVSEIEPMLGFACALAQQCFNNEYVFRTTAEELAGVERLKGSLAQASDRPPLSPFIPVLIGMYAPLHTIDGAQSLSAASWPEPLERVIAQQVTGPLQERRLRDSVTVLTARPSGVGAAVREQYEDNPYPRWISLARGGEPVSINDYVRHQFPAVAFREIDDRDRLDVLVAGCGTGRHALELAHGFRNAHVLGVDLSVSSLCYARLKTPPHLQPLIEFAQADIMRIASIGRTFDFINAAGVLHHMADPTAGCRELVKVLQPNGLMQIGLYSELARREILAARAKFTSLGLTANADDIRKARQDFAGSPEAARFLKANDFYSLSDCRDLLFHVHEHDMTIPQIKALIGECGLKFIGFDFSPQDTHVHHHGVFAAAAWSTTDLDRWHTYEQKNPSTFAGMYNFWLQKA